MIKCDGVIAAQWIHIDLPCHHCGLSRSYCSMASFIFGLARERARARERGWQGRPNSLELPQMDGHKANKTWSVRESFLRKYDCWKSWNPCFRGLRASFFSTFCCAFVQLTLGDGNYHVPRWWLSQKPEFQLINIIWIGTREPCDGDNVIGVCFACVCSRCYWRAHRAHSFRIINKFVKVNKVKNGKLSVGRRGMEANCVHIHLTGHRRRCRRVCGWCDAWHRSRQKSVTLILYAEKIPCWWRPSAFA